MIAIPPEDLPIALAVLEQKRAAWDPMDGLFPAQQRFVQDEARFIAALVGRRGGKTSGFVRRALACAQRGGRVLFVALTLESARNLFWKPFKELLEAHGFACKTNETLLEAVFPGGGEIRLKGADKPKELAKLRGVAHDLVGVDEAAYFSGYLDELVEDVLEPTLLDRLGTLVLMCTPAAGMAGLFYDVTRPELDLRKPGWSVHEWSITDNPYIPGEAELEELKRRRGWTEQTPKFIREYRGRWVRSSEDLVYRFDEKLSGYTALPAGRDWRHTLAVDVGFRDRTAFVVGAYEPGAPDFYYVHTEAESSLIPSKIAERIQALRVRFRPGRILMDCGALGLSIAEEFRQRYQLPIEAAEKKEKAAMIELLNGDLATGRVKARADSALVAEWRTLQYDEHGEEDPRCRNDLCDAALYCYRASYHYLGKPPPPPVSEEQRLREHISAVLRREREGAEGPIADFEDWGDS